MDIKDIENIIKILKQNEVTEFELEQEGTKIRLARTAAGTYITTEARLDVVPAIQPAAAIPMAASASAAAEDTSKFVKVESPIVGTFYKRPSPDAAAFVKEGDSVSKGDTLCIIEAMKLMNEIESPSSGKVVKILGADGQVVEFGEVLFLIDPQG
jgi:acetyl-CoA carboxylase biotin carboxyl carrier protein